MTEDRRDPVQELFAMFADHLEAWLAGDELALESLAGALQESEIGEEHFETALLMMQSLAGALPVSGVATLSEAPGADTQRVPSAEERDSLSPEAWGFLLGLRQRGALDPGQFERVLDRLTAIGVRPVGVELAREVAVRVAMHAAGRRDLIEYGAGDAELSH
ncbi:MAG TPA: DUF494 family protein [Candidatus Eisenbacteria bacterium]|nr:DUF494 family protein [Candidatus Eisenbacteria bacterium]